MLTTLIIIDSILLFVLLNFLALTLSMFLKQKKLSQKVDYTIASLNEVLGFLISIVGKIRKGKTSLLVALSHLYTLKFQAEIMENMMLAKKKILNIDFNDLDSYIIDLLLSTTEKVNYIEITKQVIIFFKIDDKNIVNDFINNICLNELIYEYVKNIYYLYVRNNYVMSNVKIYNIITENYCFGLDPNDLLMHVAEKQGSYKLDDYLVVLYDEITDDNYANKWQTEKNDESGNKELLRKWGQLFQEKSIYISTKQSASDEIKQHRILSNNVAHLDDKFEIINPFKMLTALINKVFDYRLKWNKRGLKLKYVRSGYWLKKNTNYCTFDEYVVNNFSKHSKQRILKSKQHYWLKYIESYGCLKYTFKNYSDVDDVGNNNYELTEIYAPLIYSFGKYETHAFKAKQRELYHNSSAQLKTIDIVHHEKNKKERSDNIDIVNLS